VNERETSRDIFIEGPGKALPNDEKNLIWRRRARRKPRKRIKKLKKK
jgi:hypothetical protein